jgi:HAD superfamily hydrolase (TIGR01509 family)
MPVPRRGLIFDFDGVIADSEALANTVLAEVVTAHGLPTTLSQALNRYMGKRWPEVIEAIEQGIGDKLPNNFSDSLKATTLERFRSELKEVAGATAFIRQFSSAPRSIASSSSIDRIWLCLSKLELSDYFGTNVFSADMVDRGKPHPDIFLLAARRMEVEPSNCIVIEDSAGGVQAGIAAGMTVIGLCAGSHLSNGHAQRLIDAGAQHTAGTWSEASVITAKLLAQSNEQT